MMKARNGFTLLELTMAMTVVAILAVAMVSAFTTGLQTWERVEQRSDAEQRVSAVLETLSADLRGAWLGPNDKGGWFTLEGQEDASSLSFTCLLSGRQTGQTLDFSAVSYYLDSSSGILWREVGPAPSEKAVEQSEQIEGQEDEIAEDVLQFSVRCWDGEEWQEVWPPAISGNGTAEQNTVSLPHIVEISMELSSGQERTRTVRTMIPIEMAHP
ncbi:MAG: prepilin-type N-terminal cleavage/methylation domain-containing protein [Armatimonadetes bacterium]|nr:prepilin-type N-terminal cleavage/methylation domain-containing protein [Armatimonadota bacterium]NIM23636.1 prepilin-type N-terminal cleavage/methylation domain-containing protein [Armatimonadota bacterium]NIM67503.1 prepilin-type N-terminal cleavage/methylation domain-containing protein [Armatimonadota bacterium]NIM75999.1 prepilin-type N-terminal cleavage/methylation domain-containing protein [Armatimonadota bacterium]NIN05688.1 prepilin-type N-terminal cleavage/methylation domain-contain